MKPDKLAELIKAYGEMRILLRDAERGVLYEPIKKTQERMARVVALIEDEIGAKIP